MFKWAVEKNQINHFLTLRYFSSVSLIEKHFGHKLETAACKSETQASQDTEPRADFLASAAVVLTSLC